MNKADFAKSRRSVSSLFFNHTDVLSATLHNVSADLNHGKDTVEFDVTTRVGTLHGESISDVIVVTGPGN